jgi:ATP-dependent helicase/nuclease subunit B
LALVLKTMNEIGKTHYVSVQWQALLTQVRQAVQAHAAHPARTVVLLPYAQLMPLARQHWPAAADGVVFVPRFETTMNWAANPAPAVAAWRASGDDLRFDAGADALTAASLLQRAGLGAQAQLLGPRLLEAAYSISPQAAAQPPAQRAAWAGELRQALQWQSQAFALAGGLALEQACAAVALAWVGSSGFASDVLFTPAVQNSTELLVVVDGLQAEPVNDALAQAFAARCVRLPWPGGAAQGLLRVHAASDAQDEAERAAACVIRRLNAGQRPVGLCATDRALTRRVRALLARERLSLRDETGWKLSTTTAAVAPMALLRAAQRGADDNALVNLAKLSPALDAQAVSAWETSLRDEPNRPLAGELTAQAAIKKIANELLQVRRHLSQPRPLLQWLADLGQALEGLGMLKRLREDAAGTLVLQALHLDDAQDLPAANQDMPLADFTRWAEQALEAASYVPEPPSDPDVIVLPLSQVLGRPLAALVLPGCDEANLPAVPEAPGPWTRAQRQVLGLPPREAAQAVQQAAWRTALQTPLVDLLWRRAHEGRAVQRSSLLQALQLQTELAGADDPRERAAVAPQPVPVPAPQGAALALQRLSASSYADLRACPYKFFALRLLGLRSLQELEGGVEKREFGTWLHAVLRQFHEQNEPLAGDFIAQTAMINIAAEMVTQAQQWSEADFLPYASMWPRVRDAYLGWLAKHRSAGAEFAAAEVSRERAWSGVQLVGKLDRVDQLRGGATLVLDYKTESQTATSARVKEPLEDTQLAFYAALMGGEEGAGELQAMYLNLSEKEAKPYVQDEVLAARDALLEGISADVARISAGAPMPPLGEGRVCEHCDARGLCRKDWWGAPLPARAEPADAFNDNLLGDA